MSHKPENLQARDSAALNVLRKAECYQPVLTNVAEPKRRHLSNDALGSSTRARATVLLAYTVLGAL